ncbi:FAD-dependent oxidoreductase [Desulfosoma caldarium]|uniref:Heterodisulfide reductase subunit A n=1 Tax=Desulfosoma caldarium TaxID=610254 RepID=A0A3N1UVR6_9BACT|nr:FAD-dependent oxidoreductase [Desulfosoma caldarium]ROQ92001.1 heterodisulfide reductase subunit A [Desulfosoma caldarium]
MTNATRPTPANTIGSVMVVGGGIAGVQAALDLADSGYFVHLVESSSAIGGVMATLDKTFPTDDCSLCILSPKLVEVGRHLNIQLHTLAEVKGVSGQAGNFRVTVFQRARYIDMEKCIGCGTCAEKCPRKVPDEYNAGLGRRKAAYVKFPQAVPLKYLIDKDHCIYFEKGKCRACEKFCPTQAVNFDDKDREFTLDVGSIILAPGFEPFDPRVYDTYNYAKLPNVVTSMEFERILSASGPFEGHLVRPSDHQEPKKIAWLQCVGSRDIHHCDNGYCSSVCCMYAIKQAGIAIEHAGPDLETAIFFMDMRTPGKDFDKYYERAQKEKGVRFIRSRVHSIEAVPGTDDLAIQYVTEDGRVVEEIFNLVVLSVGLQISQQTLDLAERLGVEIGDGRFAATSPFEPVQTSRDGIFVCGVFQSPKDIPLSVMEASAAAAESAALLAPARNTLTRKPPALTEKDVATQEPRVGVFVCHCGVNIAGVIDVAAVADYAETLPSVVYVERNLFTCAQDTQDKMKKVIEDHKLNRIVVAACSPRTHEPLFQETLKQAGLNKYLFEMANIRNMGSWVHMNEPEAATEKAKDMVRMAVAKVALQQPLSEVQLNVTKSGLVVGGGIAGMTAALTLADQGYPVTLVERKDVLGGHGRKLYSTWDGQPIAPFLDELINRVIQHPKITVYTNTHIRDVQGFVGNFHTVLDVGGSPKEVDHGVAILAIGAHSLKPTEYGYGQSDRIFLNLDLDQAISQRDSRIVNANSAVFIQCVGSREPQRPYCSRVCCSHSIENALRLKKLNPDLDVFMLYRDIRTFGLRENLYKEARARGVLFIRFDLDNKPQVQVASDGSLTVTVLDHILQRPIVLKPDILTLASAIVMRTEEADELAKMFKVPLNAEGFFLEAHAKLRPVDFATDGVFIAGLAHYPKPTEECIAQAKAAAARAATVLAKDSILAGGVVAVVNKDLCCGCQGCVQCCPFGAISYLEQEAKCEVNHALCKGCGTCAATCPSEAITLLGFSHLQLYTQIDEALSA